MSLRAEAAEGAGPPSRSLCCGNLRTPIGAAESPSDTGGRRSRPANQKQTAYRANTTLASRLSNKQSQIKGDKPQAHGCN
ncbi:hypothetical protein EYF80_033225 [Liparis tanakae]|uniref:Uncharacterized protein n=1 Tax=Liparis tanakae TaxID=230148 RepID=A0A4Z2GTJ9_9TELE|nr:hypothetical protein EYF80_033225 [Liparis tanakae]